MAKKTTKRPKRRRPPSDEQRVDLMLWPKGRAVMATRRQRQGTADGGGRWLRRTNLDELPQFWNVLVGDTSYAELFGARYRRPDFITVRRTRS